MQGVAGIPHAIAIGVGLVGVSGQRAIIDAIVAPVVVIVRISVIASEPPSSPASSMPISPAWGWI
jgi:hypothetical protein